jgi:rod shape-determining protein MreD
MKNLGIIGFGFLMLVLQTALATLVPLHSFAPNIVLPIAVFLGLRQEVALVRGALVAFLLGYLLDAFCGSPVGLQTLVTVAAFLFAREVGLRLFFRGPLFQLVLTFATSLLAGGTILALRAIFEKDVFETVQNFQTGELRITLLSTLKSAIATTLIAPLLFWVVGKIEGVLVQRSDEGPASR